MRLMMALCCAQEEAVGVEDSVDDSDGGYGPNGILRFAGVADVHMFPSSAACGSWCGRAQTE